LLITLTPKGIGWDKNQNAKLYAIATPDKSWQSRRFIPEAPFVRALPAPRCHYQHIQAHHQPAHHAQSG
jgi:hypothetical protein